MANGIIPVQWGKELRPSAVNSLDKINEVIHFINQSEIHEFTLSDSGIGESVQTANSTQLLDLTVYGKSVQNGTPTPSNPVPVQVVEAPINLQIGESLTPIDLQGHVLASLPDGTRDILRVDSTGRVWIEQNVGKYVLTSAQSWPESGTQVGSYYRVLLANVLTQPSILYSASTANSGLCDYARFNPVWSEQSEHVYTDNYNLFVFAQGSSIADAREAYTGATIYYTIATPVTIELGTIEPPAIPDGSIIQINASLTPVIDVEWFTETTLPKMMNSILDLVKSLHPNDFTASSANANTLHSANQLTQVSEIQPIDIMDMGTIDKIRENEIEDENKDESEVN